MQTGKAYLTVHRVGPLPTHHCPLPRVLLTHDESSCHRQEGGGAHMHSTPGRI
jgi:hypothetical protein